MKQFELIGNAQKSDHEQKMVTMNNVHERKMKKLEIYGKSNVQLKIDAIKQR